MHFRSEQCMLATKTYWLEKEIALRTKGWVAERRSSRSMRRRKPRRNRLRRTRPRRSSRQRRLPGLQIRALKFQSSSSKFQNFELANLRTFLNFRTSPYHFPAIYQFSKNAAFWKNPEKIWPKFSKNSAKFGKICKILQNKNSKKFSNF